MNGIDWNFSSLKHRIKWEDFKIELTYDEIINEIDLQEGSAFVDTANYVKMYKPSIESLKQFCIERLGKEGLTIIEDEFTGNVIIEFKIPKNV